MAAEQRAATACYRPPPKGEEGQEAATQSSAAMAHWLAGRRRWYGCGGQGQTRRATRLLDWPFLRRSQDAYHRTASHTLRS